MIRYTVHEELFVEELFIQQNKSTHRQSWTHQHRRVRCCSWHGRAYYEALFVDVDKVGSMNEEKQVIVWMELTQIVFYCLFVCFFSE